MFAEILIAVIVILLVISAWFDFAKAILHLIWMFRIPIIIALILCYGPRFCDWLFGTNLQQLIYGTIPA